MELDPQPKRRRAWMGATVGAAIPALLYVLFFFSLKNPPGSPPLGGDGDWAGLAFVIYAPGLLVAVAACAGVGWLIGNSK